MSGVRRLRGGSSSALDFRFAGIVRGASDGDIGWEWD